MWTLVVHGYFGIIPANTGRILFSFKTTWCHWGSSPRIRGESLWTLVVHGYFGIIPANTGRMEGVLQGHRGFGDHPREYGENVFQCLFRRVGVGSSPRIRGECFSKWIGGHFGGIIPANTGRIHVDQAHTSIQGDHPREYGEND